MSRKISIEILVLLMVVLFLYAGFSKLIDVRFFKNQLIRSPWIGKYNSLIAWSIPFFEIAVSTLLLTGGRLRTLGLFAFGISLLIFSGYITLVLISGQAVPCSCGGLIQKLSWPQHIVLNLSFASIAFIVVNLQKVHKADIELSQSISS